MNFRSPWVLPSVSRVMGCWMADLWRRFIMPLSIYLVYLAWHSTQWGFRACLAMTDGMGEVVQPNKPSDQETGHGTTTAFVPSFRLPHTPRRLTKVKQGQSQSCMLGKCSIVRSSVCTGSVCLSLKTRRRMTTGFLFVSTVAVYQSTSAEKKNSITSFPLCSVLVYPLGRVRGLPCPLPLPIQKRLP